jgi:hypothetical protein
MLPMIKKTSSIMELMKMLFIAIAILVCATAFGQGTLQIVNPINVGNNADELTSQQPVVDYTITPPVFTQVNTTVDPSLLGNTTPTAITPISVTPISGDDPFPAGLEIAPAPEPSTFAIVGLCLFLLALMRLPRSVKS